MACKDSWPKPEGIYERRQVCREILEMIARHGATRIAMPPLRQGKGVHGRGQVRQHAFEGVQGIAIAVQAQHGNARGVSLLNILELHLVGKLDRLDNRCHAYCVHSTLPFFHYLFNYPNRTEGLSRTTRS
jgi:hypothetical protein